MKKEVLFILPLLIASYVCQTCSPVTKDNPSGDESGVSELLIPNYSKMSLVETILTSFESNGDVSKTVSKYNNGELTSYISYINDVPSSKMEMESTPTTSSTSSYTYSDSDWVIGTLFKTTYLDSSKKAIKSTLTKIYQRGSLYFESLMENTYSGNRISVANTSSTTYYNGQVLESSNQAVYKYVDDYNYEKVTSSGGREAMFEVTSGNATFEKYCLYATVGNEHMLMSCTETEYQDASRTVVLMRYYKSYSNGEMKGSSKTEYEYVGDNVSKVTTYTDEVLDGKTQYEYKKGNLARILVYGSDGYLVSRSDYSYSGNTVVGVEEYDINDTLIGKTEYDFKATSDKSTKSSKVNGTWRVDSTQENKYSLL